MCEHSITRRVLYSGRVQGVGFRWTVEKIARRFPVTGFVRNLSDGRVELVVSGSVEALDNLQDDIREQFARNITSIEAATLGNPDEFVGFRIRH